MSTVKNFSCRNKLSDMHGLRELHYSAGFGFLVISSTASSLFTLHRGVSAPEPIIRSLVSVDRGSTPLASRLSLCQQLIRKNVDLYHASLNARTVHEEACDGHRLCTACWQLGVIAIKLIILMSGRGLNRFILTTRIVTLGLVSRLHGRHYTRYTAKKFLDSEQRFRNWQTILSHLLF